ncbi:MAG: hypothetical protein HYW63_00960 [Candidatus Levybacteria bacterium]|nr:hypothetical protein [Candidatus Levybacteria bacterium]
MKVKIRKFKKNVLDILLKILLIILFSITTFLLGVLFEKTTSKNSNSSDFDVSQNIDEEKLSALQNKVIKDSYVLNIKWADLGRRMVEDGVIDKVKLAQAVTGGDELPKDLDKYFEEGQDQIEVNLENSQFWVDILWGLGLANRNRILEEGEMMVESDPSIFASTGGWSLGVGDPMDHYSGHSYITLSKDQQKAVSEIAGSIYRPCCGNSTAFPDCNHGMAMLGLIELMVSQGKSQEEIYKAALALNTYWFPDTYLDIAYFFEENGREFAKVSPKELLSKTFSSSDGYGVVRERVGQIPWPSLDGEGGSCSA